MEGYSVTEAASILGVPTERVWELLARGILSGAPDGETGMRVFLQPRPAPPPAPVEVHAQADASRGEPERELSPFRELLTEFRNLTERYGQALLALGESRGEVAALRSRVDLLEARMDLRLPGAAAPSPAMPWLGRPSGADEPPPPASPASAAPSEVSAEAHADEPHDPVADDAELDAPARRRRSSNRHATDAFAEALARAQDPSLRDLPGAAEAADALAALREQARAARTEPQPDRTAEREPEGPEAALPRELPVAEPVPVPEESEAAAPSPEPEPESEPEVATTPEAEPPAERAQPEAAVGEAGEPRAGEAMGEPEIPEPQAPLQASEREPMEAAPEASAEVAEANEAVEAAAALQEAATAAVMPEAVPSAETSITIEPQAPPETEVESAPAPPTEEPEPMVGQVPEVPEAESKAGVSEAEARATMVEPPSEPAHETEPEAAEPFAPEEPIDWDRDRYTTSLGEPDWYAAEDLPYEPPEPVATAPAVEEPEPVPAAPAVEPPEPVATAPAVEEPEPVPAAPAVEEPEPAATAPGVEELIASAGQVPSAGPPSTAGEPLPDRSAAPQEEFPPAEEPAPPPERAAAEEHLLWFGREPGRRDDLPTTPEAAKEGAEEMEVAGTGTPPSGRQTTRLPGAWDLDDALAALDALAGRKRGAGEEGAQPQTAASTPSEHRSPASRAYRRLRRILPG